MDFAPYFSKMSRFLAPPSIAVIHHTADPEDHDIEYYNQMHINQGWVCFGAHALCRMDGSIQYGRPVLGPAGGLGFIGAHAYGINSLSIGVETTGNYMTGTPSETIINALIDLVTDWCKKLPIKYIIGHRDVSTIIPYVESNGERISTATACPGDNLYSQITRIAETVSKNVGRVITDPYMHDKELLMHVATVLDGSKEGSLSEKGIYPPS